ncbi:unnamed protein product, partial [Chrysoparadoxa australica]
MLLQDLTRVEAMEVTLAKGSQGGTFGVTLGSPLEAPIMTFEPRNTGNWGTLHVQTFAFIPKAYESSTSLCIVGVTGYGIANIDSIKLTDGLAIAAPVVLTRYSSSQVEIGLHPGSNWNDIGGYERELGVKFGYKLLYVIVEGLGQHTAHWVKRYIDEGYGVELNLEFFEDYPNLNNIVDGQYDDKLHSLITGLEQVGSPAIWIRPLHEFNGDWYNWGIYYGNQTGEQLIRAYRHVVEVFRSRGANVKFQANYNSVNPR